MSERIAIASDHAGYSLKSRVGEWLVDLGYEPVDLGADGPQSVDYPDYGVLLAKALKDGTAERGIIVCGSGIGISISANRYPWVRAALCTEPTAARLCREHNDANVLALGERLIGEEVAKSCVEVFLETEFDGGERHARRVAKLNTPEEL